MNKKSEYYKGLDGLRALAIIFVILYHLKVPFFSGGYIGVDIFFVVSGFLITSILIDTYLRRKNSSIKKYFINRIIRIVPTTYFVLFLIIISTFLINSEMFEILKNNIFYAMSFTSNYGQIIENVDYFTASKFLNPTLHLWSIAVEMQFYLFIGVLFVFLKKKIKSTNKFIIIISSFILISLILNYVLFDINDISRTYYATSTRIYELLVGSLLAFVYKKKIASLLLEKLSNSKVALNISTILLIFIITLFVTIFNDNTTFLFRGGFIIISLISAILIFLLQVKNNYIAMILESKYIKGIGKRSFSLYLIHYPVIVLLLLPQNIGKQPLFVTLLIFLIIVVVTEFTYNIIEKPTHNKSKMKFISYGIIMLMFILSVICFTSSTVNELKFEESNKILRDFASDTYNIDLKISNTHESFEIYKEAEDTLDSKNILLIGDSIAEGLSQHFENSFSNAKVDGEVGRQMSEANELADEYQNYNNSDSIVILELGTNGTFNYNELEEFINKFDQTDIYLITSSADRVWVEDVNEKLTKASEEFDNVYLIDWNSYADGHDEYYVYDGVHLNSQGIETYTNFIKSTMFENIKYN